MRGIAYVVAALAAVGIMIVIASRPAPPTVETASSDSPVVAATEVATSESGTITLAVPEMHCPFACYPKVKETLEGTAAVNSVELAPQKEEGVIDNRQVIVNYNAGFNATDAIRLLSDEGFSDSAVVQ